MEFTKFKLLKLAKCEDHWKKNIGKPYEGKPHVRLDEGEAESKRDSTSCPFEISFLLY
jgi:hypothetical protein